MHAPMQEHSDAAGAEREIEELLQFVYLMPVAIARLGERGAVEMLNPKAVQILADLDIDSGQADGPVILDALEPGLAARWRASAGVIGPVLTPQRCTLARPDGVALHLLLQVVRPDERCTMLAIEDVTTTVEQERELTRQRRRIGLVLEHIQGYCVAMLDAAGSVTEWNPSIGRLLGRAADQVVGQPLLDWVVRPRSAEDPAAGLAGTDAATDPPSDFGHVAGAVALQGWCRLQMPCAGADGQILWGDCVVTPVVEADGQTQGFVAVIRDVTEEHLRTQELIDAALTDPLTGLFNRRGLERRLALLHDRPGTQPSVLSWIMSDIDHFKHVNDTYGHDGGDAVLKAVAASLRGAGRDRDTLARFGGEEFVLLLVDATADVAASVAERLRTRVAALSVVTGPHTVGVTASFGVAQQAPGEAWTAALERADAAMYRAKQGGRNRVVVAEEPGRVG
jgi:diguanylate cyclase (GGDEF)-like protein